MLDRCCDNGLKQSLSEHEHIARIVAEPLSAHLDLQSGFFAGYVQGRMPCLLQTRTIGGER